MFYRGHSNLPSGPVEGLPNILKILKTGMLKPCFNGGFDDWLGKLTSQVLSG